MKFIKNFFLFFVIAFLTSIFGSLLVIEQAIKSYSIEKITDETENRVIDSIDVGETREFYINTGDPNKTFKVNYLFKERIESTDNKFVQYKVETTITNGLNSAPIAYIEIFANDANDAGLGNYYNEGWNVNIHSGKSITKTSIFSAPDSGHVEFFVKIKYNNFIEANYIFLLPFAKPTITNINIQKNIYTPKIIKINWVFDGKESAISPRNSSIIGSGISGGDIQVDPLSNSSVIKDLGYAAEYNDWTMKIAYQSGFVDETKDKFSEVNLPSFITFNKDMDLIPTFSYKTIEKGKLDVAVEINNITNTPFKYTNFTFWSSGASLVDSRDITINKDGIYNFNNIQLTQEVYNDFKVTITVKDKFSTYDYTKDLPSFTVAPTINNLEETINPDNGEISLKWDIDDNNNFFNSFYLYDEKKDSVIFYLTSSAIATHSLSIMGLDGDVNYEWSIRGDWSSDSNSGTTISNHINFDTVWRHESPPKIISSNYSRLLFDSVSINWELYDEDDNISKVYLYDELNNDVVHTMTKKELVDQKVTINSLNPETNYSWTLRVEWDDPNYGGETTIVGELMNFSTGRKPYDVPSIDTFNYRDLDYDSATIYWTITDLDNVLTQFYLYDLINQTVLDKPLDKESGEIKLDNLVSGQEYSFELRGTWLDPIYSSGEIVSDNSIYFVVPYSYKEIPTIDDFTYKNLTYDSVTLDWKITDKDKALKNIYLYDTISEEIIATNLDKKSSSFILDGLVQGKKYNLVLKGTWLDEHYSSGEIRSSNSVSFIVPFTPKEIPTINDFNYSDLNYNSVTINWLITDKDNALQAVYLYDLINQTVFKTNLDTKDSLTINNLVQGERYKLELCGTWLDENYSSGEIKSDNVIEFTVPYKHETAPEITSFSINEVTTTSTTISWDISDPDNAITSVYLYDEINNEVVYEFNKEELLAKQATIDNLEKIGTQKWSLKVQWIDPGYGEETITSDIQEFKIPSEKKSLKTLHIWFGMVILIIVIILIISTVSLWVYTYKNKLID